MLGGVRRFLISFSTLLTDSPCAGLLLRSKDIPEKILQLLEDLYSNTFSCIRVDGELLHGLRPPLEAEL